MLNRGALRGLLVALMLLVESGSGEADPDALSPSPSDLLEHPDRYDGKVVRLEGPVESFREKVSQDGTPFFRFVVTDGSRGVAVFGIGRSTCRDGMRATVEGRFEKVNRLGRHIIYQVILATRVACR